LSALFFAQNATLSRNSGYCVINGLSNRSMSLISGIYCWLQNACDSDESSYFDGCEIALDETFK